SGGYFRTPILHYSITPLLQDWSPPVPLGGLLVGVSGAEDRLFGEWLADDLEADREAVLEAARDRDGADAGHVDRDGADVGELHRQRVVALLADPEGDRR